jgi:hypothetical protein
MAPTLVASYFVKTSTQGTTPLVTPSFTPSNGELLVIKMETWSTGVSMGSLTGGGQTYTSRVINAPGGGKPWEGIYTAVISGSPGSMTVSATPSASARYSMCVERWSNAQLAGTPVVASANGSGLPQGSLTTGAANGIVSWVSGDVFSIDPATRAYLGSGTDDGVRDDHAGGNGVGYHAYMSAPSAGSVTFGLSAPTGQSWGIAGIEIQDTGGGTVNGPATIAGAGTVTAAASVRVPGSASLAGAGTVSAAGSVRVPGSASLAGAGAVSAAASVQVPGVAAIASAGVLSASSGSTTAGTAAPAGAGSLSAAASVRVPGSVTLAAAGTLTASGSVRVPGVAALAAAGTLTVTPTVRVTGAAALVGAGSLAITIAAVKATSTSTVTAGRTSTAAVTARANSTAAVTAARTSTGGVT